MARSTEGGRTIAIAEQRSDRRGQRLGIPGGDEQPGPPVQHEVGQPAGAGGNDRQPGRHRLEDRERLHLMSRRLRVHRGREQERRGVIDVAAERDHIAERERRALRSERARMLAIARLLTAEDVDDERNSAVASRSTSMFLIGSSRPSMRTRGGTFVARAGTSSGTGTPLRISPSTCARAIPRTTSPADER